MTKRLMMISLISHSLALLAIIVIALTGRFIALEEQNLHAIGQVLSSMDIACGLVTYYQSGKGQPQIILFILPSIAAPVYSLIGGELYTVASYFVVGLIIQALVTYRFWKVQDRG